MNIHIDKAVEDLTLATLDGRVAAVAATNDVAYLKSYFAIMLAAHTVHNELTEQMPEPM